MADLDNVSNGNGAGGARANHGIGQDGGPAASAFDNENNTIGSAVTELVPADEGGEEVQNISNAGKKHKNLTKTRAPNDDGACKQGHGSLAKKEQETRQGRLRQTLLIVNAMSTLLFVGATLGFGPMQLMLEDHGSFSSQCTQAQQNANEICDEQSGRLVSIGISMTATQVLSPLLGFTVDHIGAKLSSYLQAAFAIIGLTMVLVATSVNQDILLFVGFATFSLQTWMGNIMIVQLGLYFSGHKISRVIFILNTLFDSGAVTWLGLWGIQQGTNASTPVLIGGYLVAAVVFYTVGTYAWTVAVPENKPDEHDGDGNEWDEQEASYPQSSLEFIVQNHSHHTSVSLDTSRERMKKSSVPIASAGRRSSSGTGLSDDGSRSSFIANRHLALELSRRLAEDEVGEADGKHSGSLRSIPNLQASFHGGNSSSMPFMPTRRTSFHSKSFRHSTTRALSFVDDQGASCLNNNNENSDVSSTKNVSASADDHNQEGPSEAASPDVSKPSKDSDTPGEYIAVADRPPTQQLTSIPFVLLTVFFGLQVCTTNWNMSTQRDFLKHLGDDDHDNLYLMIFILLTPVSILGGPAIDWVILRWGWIPALQGINILAIAFQLIKVTSDNLNVQIVQFVIFSFYRSFLFGVTFAFLPTLIAGHVVGKAAGIMGGLSGVINLCMFPLSNLAIERQDGDFFVANTIILCLMLPSLVVISVLRKYIKKEERALEEKEQALATTATTTPIVFDDVDGVREE